MAAQPMRRNLAIVLGGVLLGAALPWGSSVGAESAAERGEFVLRTYEVGDLVVSVPDYGSPTSDVSSATSGRGGFGGGGFGGGGGGGGGFFSVPDAAVAAQSAPIMAQFGGRGGVGRGGGARAPAPRSSDPFQIDFDSLIDAMTSSCAPATWSVNGGGDGDVRVVGAALVVWQTPEVHERIDDFLRQLREGSARRRTASIDARWLLLSSDDLDQLAKVDDEGARSLDRDRLEQFTRRTSSLRAMTSCFSGQAVYVVSGTRRNIVTSYIPVVGSVDLPHEDEIQYTSTSAAKVTWLQNESASGYGGGRSVGYQPVVQSVNFGVELRIRPTLMHGENAAVVDLTSTVTFPGISQPNAADSATPGDMAPAVDRLAIDAQELATTLRVPLGKPVLVGGMSHIANDAEGEGGVQANAAADEETRQLYLILEVR